MSYSDTNCKDEFISHTADNEPNILCVIIMEEIDYDQYKDYILKENYTAEEYDAFLKSINFTYDSGYGGQCIFGYIWYDDGTWSERGEYDGSEWWVYKSCPEIPAKCKR